MTCLFWKMAKQKLHSKMYFYEYEQRLNDHKDTIYVTEVTDVKSTVTNGTYCDRMLLFRRSRRTNKTI